MAPISINGNTLDPVVQGPVLRALGLEAPDASGSDYVLIQVSDARTTPEQKGNLANLGLVLHGYISEKTYLYSYEGTDLQKIRSLPFVIWADIYLKQFKYLPGLSGPAYSRTTNTVDIIFHEGVDTSSGRLKRDIAAAAHIDRDGLELGRNKVRLTVEERWLDLLASIDAVRAIQKVRPPQLHNNVARSIMNASVTVSGIAYQGEGEVVAVADTGFDKGDVSATHPAFTGRVVKLYDLGRPGKFDDPDGHGTHVCGSVLGSGTSASAGGTIQGTAPKARLVMQSLIGDLGGLSGVPVDLHDLFAPPYNNEKARVHTNSWGLTMFAGIQNPYDSQSNDIDDFVWNNPDLVGSTAAAKNCITVGACESVRREAKPVLPTYGDVRPSSFPVPPLKTDLMANNAEGMAAFSSRGPTLERRFKPDVVAPGTSILSTHSRNAPASDNAFGTSPDPDWFFDSGTSMATPLVAGCAAVLRETLVKNGFPKPPASLVKALLVNGAAGLTGQYSPPEVGSTPNKIEGFGRVNLAGSVIIPSPGVADGGFGEGGPLKEGDKDVIDIEIPPRPPQDKNTFGPSPPSAATFKMTLVWSDPPELNGMLQNDLDLIVVAADGSERHGNMGTAAGFDTVNNVEQVLWAKIPTGHTQLVIRATHITKFPQLYAYAWRITW
ncbi:peptidase S8 and S53 [Lasiosphaeria miniovina]|uniref:Peptidase S8 and S53 n=1 Tax=Lasiosphaeria miniovina TaxID=1954250 RepID=A0AA40E7D2_9PEZI|nr:peptidase S8 and S53 [Lasiosphaeria miniovina]KAK0727777.1 peptidase S8 and S53 [Lasiosphaeria miniovina]